MDDVVIKVENLSKRYRIGSREEMHDTFVGAALSSVLKPFKNLRNLRDLTQFDPDQESDDVIWALKDVSFEVKRGEILGIIGRNGAGKSTLLKILSRITHPTKGRVEIKGRVSSLLEVGTGFHRELTGRENIFLNGSILGMTKKEIDSKFNEIVDFSGVEKFIDTPVKHYSSGMYVRLAFAVAAHLEPEILLVDEVLAVGDAEFQKKCLGKMGEVAAGGRTVLFVSHNMGAIQTLCNRALLIIDGLLLFNDLSHSIINKYKMNLIHDVGFKYECKEIPNLRAWIESAVIKLGNGQESGSFLMTEPFIVSFDIFLSEIVKLTLNFQIKETNGTPLFHFSNEHTNFIMPNLPGSYHIEARVPALYLYPGKYEMFIRLNDVTRGDVEAFHTVNLSLDVLQNYSLWGKPLKRPAGIIFSSSEWQADKFTN